MALSGSARPLLDGLRPAPGSLRLIALRVAVVLLSSAPALIAGIAGVSGGAARRPYYTDVEGRLPLIHLFRFFKELPDGFAPALAVAVVLAILGDQIVTGGALAIADPGRPAGERVKVLATVSREGLSHLWAFLRVVGLGLVIVIVGIALIRLPFKKLGVTGYRSGWSGQTMAMTLPLLSMITTALWLATAGAWVFWCRLITAADGRRRVRRTAILALRVLWRYPLRSWGFFAVTTLATVTLSGALLVAWRQAEPGTGGGALGWFLGWLLTLLVQAAVWLWLVRAGRLLYADASLADLRSQPDDPFRLLSKLAFWRRRRASVAPAAAGAPAAVASPAREASAEDSPVENPPAEDRPANDPPVDDPPVKDRPVED